MLWYIVTAAMRPTISSRRTQVGRVRAVLGSIRHETRIRRSADEVWQLVGDAARLYEWFPGITSSPVDGTSRLITTDAGLPMPEEILVVDPVQRRFQYRLTSPMIRHHRGTIDVLDLDRRLDVRRRLLDRGRPAGDGPRDRRRHGGGTRRAAAPDGDRRAGRRSLEWRSLMGRKILLVTTDQQRFDTLGCNGGTIARTPVADSLAAAGYRYERAHPQSVVCMPSRSTIITGQHPSTHGVWMNGVPLPVDAPSVASVLHQAGYRTAIIGKPHFEPFLDPFARFVENGFARCGHVHDHAAIVRRQHHRTAPWIRALRVGDPHRRRVAALREVARRRPSRGGRDVLPGARSRSRGQRARRRRHRRPTGARQPDPPRVVPHRLGGRPHDRLARLAGRRRRLVLLDELSRPAPPVGPTGRRALTRRLARRAIASWIHRRRRGARSRCSTASHDTGGRGTTAGWSRTTRHPCGGCRQRSPPTRSARSMPATPSSASSSTRRSAGCWRRSMLGVGVTMSTWCSRPTTASCRVTSGCCSRGRTTSTG